jgi:hypothetical protein
VAGVVGGVVHQHGDRPVRRRRLRHRRLQRRDVGDVARDEQRRVGMAGAELRHEVARVRALHEGDPAALRGEALGQARADARAAAGDEDALASEVMEGRAWRHGRSPGPGGG